ncbi:tetratricopeptide repeat protein [Achromobacter aloeverae]|uniref:Uncharacterized protein n=1 Tax=Achromobacter aloeverae TaxID=1750518 RepID=A0A4Q1HIA5_9BURK|nr:hypothetical protein [Achromobacter aloeverae]RXN87777.1 hypothetical protein C7R54_14350 [Achromobacter aloeverae]
MNTTPNERAMVAAMERLRRAVGELAQGGGRRLAPAARKSLYERGHALYESKRYEQAYALFVQLVADNPADTLALQAAASAAQAQGKYELALDLYAPLMMSTEDPLYAARFAECLLKLGKVDHAKEAIDIARSLCVGDEHGAVREYCATLQCQADRH